MGERSSWIQTFTGIAFDPLNPRMDMIEPVDIAHALGMQCRFNGHCTRFYSVAEHCLAMSHAVSPRHALWALLHDAAEAYIGDMVRPLKRSIGLATFPVIEDQILGVILDWFGVPRLVPREVIDADTRILLDERSALFGPPPLPWDADEANAEPLGVEIWCLSPQDAEAAWLERLETLMDVAEAQPWK